MNLRFICPEHYQYLEENPDQLPAVWYKSMTLGKELYEKNDYSNATAAFGSAYNVIEIALRYSNFEIIPILNKLTIATQYLSKSLKQSGQTQSSRLIYAHTRKYLAQARNTNSSFTMQTFVADALTACDAAYKQLFKLNEQKKLLTCYAKIFTPITKNVISLPKQH